MMNDWINFYLILGLALISPGPMFFGSLACGLQGNKKQVLLFSAGGSLALLTHSLYIVPGFGYLLKKSESAQEIMAFLGSLYLVYLGVRLLFSKTVIPENPQEHVKSSKGSGFSRGYLISLLDPLVVIFLTMLFTTVLPQRVLLFERSLFCFQTILFAFLFYSMVGLCCSSSWVQRFLSKQIIRIERAIGVIFIFFGLHLFWHFFRTPLENLLLKF